MTITSYDSVKPFRNSSDAKATLIVLTSLAPYLIFLYCSYYLSQYSYFWVLALALPTHFFHARMFIVMHDCGHSSLFKTGWLNNLFGHITGFFYFTPFLMWRELHNKHHSNQGYLHKRGKSLDVWTMTTAEYEQAPFATQLLYRVYRHPAVLFFLAPLVLFLFIFRLPFEKFSLKAALNILILDFILVAWVYFAPQSFWLFIKIQAPSLLLSFFMASFLFYVQHQFENTIWFSKKGEHHEILAMKGSSYILLPSFLEWCYGNINYHHIHHLDVKIPMYHLLDAQKCLQYSSSVSALSLAEALLSTKFKLWDENKQRLISFDSL